MDEQITKHCNRENAYKGNPQQLDVFRSNKPMIFHVSLPDQFYCPINIFESVSGTL